MSLGRNLQYLRRLSKNMTQEALASRLHVSRQTVSKWEMEIYRKYQKGVSVSELEREFSFSKIPGRKRQVILPVSVRWKDITAGGYFAVRAFR